jgi:activating signal cointegrator complex subunit 3
MLLDQVIRVIQSFIDITATKKYLNTTIKLIEVLQMVIQAKWIDEDPLLNFLPNLNENLISLLNKNDLKYLPQLINYDFQKLNNILNLSNEKFLQLKNVLESLPNIVLDFDKIIFDGFFFFLIFFRKFFFFFILRKS